MVPECHTVLQPGSRAGGGRWGQAGEVHVEGCVIAHSASTYVSVVTNARLSCRAPEPGATAGTARGHHFEHLRRFVNLTPFCSEKGT